MDIKEAIHDFREAAIKKGDFLIPAKADHKCHAIMVKAFHYLKGQGKFGDEAFYALLRDESPYVAIWVAAQLLSEGKDEAKEILIKLNNESLSKVMSFNIEIILEEYNLGRYTSPFGLN